MAETEASLLQILAEIDFAKRYYTFYEARKHLQGAEGIDPAAIAVRLEPRGFKFHKRDRFYRLAERQGDREVELHVAFALGTVELILGLEAGEATYGGPFAGMAEEVAQLEDPDFSYQPPYPKIPYSTAEDLDEVIDFGIKIYEEVKARLFAAAKSK